MENYKAKFMCSYGGEIKHDSHDHKLSYVGGDTKILYVDPRISFPAMLAKLSALCNAAGDVSFKYQLPGEGLNALISVTGDDDLENMMLEYDQVHRASAAATRMRLFVFPNNNPPSHSLDSGPDSAQPDPVYAPTEEESTFHAPWGTSKHVSGCVASSSRLIGPLPATKYDVFISFRGEDTRTNFTCHLHEALSRKQIKTFIDYELHKGDEISPSLSEAIESSYVSVVVFSKNYASSKWCLEELVKILECRTKHGQFVIPVFYNINPSDVRKQEGSYKEAFEKHLQNCMLDMNKVKKWKDALTGAADLAGWDSHSRSYRDDSELIQRIVKDVLQKLNYHYPPNDFKHLIGIHKNSAPIESLLREAQSVGIWGIGGIGKTTTARYIFDNYSNQYEGSCFLENIREISEEPGQGLHILRNQLHSELLRDNICQNSTAKSTFFECRIRRQRNFIVLDDVSSSKQLEYLVGELQSYGPDSKIIITTRDKSVLINRRVERIHEVGGLDFHESLTLFSLSAFNEDPPKVGYKELSRRAVAYCKGVPLALVVLGSFLHSKGEVEWGSALNKIEKIPNWEIQNVLKLSYDGLDSMEQQIFLDIACFFKGELKEKVANLFDSCGFYGVIGMRSLLDKALITISSYNTVGMHDLIQQMGWEIVRQESFEDPGKRSRLWDFDDACDVLKNNKGTDAIRAIILDMSQSGQNLCLSADTFEKMPNLRYLRFFISSCIDGRFCDLQLPAGLKSFSDKLRYFEWHAYPLQSLPSNFCPEKLVTLSMPYSQLKRLWSGVQNLVNLKDVDLAACHELIELPDFSEAQNLEIVHLAGCRSLRHVHPSILSRGTLQYLNLEDCESLETLESEIHLGSLSVLRVDNCSSLKKVSLSLEAVQSLDFSEGVSASHLSIGHLSKLEYLLVEGYRLENLPKEWSCLKSLKKLELCNYSRVISKHTLHVIFDGLQFLQELYLIDCHGLSELPDNINHLSSLRELYLDRSHVERLPENIKHLSGLIELSVKDCRRLQSLPELPSSVSDLIAINCPLLPTVASSLTNPTPQEQKRKSISFENGVNLDVEERIYSLCQRKPAYAHELRMSNRLFGNKWYFGLIIRCPGHRVPEWFTHRTKGASITFELDQPLDNYSSFLLCVVVSPCVPRYPESLDFRYECCLEDGRCSSGSDVLVNHYPLGRWDFDHVYMSCRGGIILKHITEQRVNNQSTLYSCNPKITLAFYGVNGDIYFDEFIKECGVHLERAQPSSKKLKQSC